MANDRLYIGNKVDNTYVFVDKGWGAGWKGGCFNAALIQEYLETTYEDGNGGKPTVLEFFSEASPSANDYLSGGKEFVILESGVFGYNQKKVNYGANRNGNFRHARKRA